jgi:two-component system chemotaxis sensor kinase CheA
LLHQSIHYLPFTIYYSPVDDRTRREFLAEIEELIEQLFAETEELRRQQDHVPVRRELLGRVFRCVHSIKGVAASAGFDSVSELAHQVESLLDSARAGRIAVDDSVVDTLGDATNAMSESLSAAAAGNADPPPPALIKRLTELAERDSGAPTVNAELRLPDLPAVIAQSVNERERRLMLEALREDERLYMVAVSFDVATFDKEFHGLREALTHSGEVIATVPTAESSRPDRISFRIVYAADLELPELKSRFAAFHEIIFTELGPQQTNKSETDVDEARSLAAADSARPASASLPSSFIRLDLDELDRLISSAHEVFRETNRALDFVSSNLVADSRAELENLDAQLRQSLMALEEQIINLRMVSLGRTIQRAIRAGRVAARVSGKEIEFSAAGSDLRIDKLLSDAIADPLVHLVRNAVDHGFETSAERTKAGKKSAGRVHIDARSEGGRARISVRDDGRGIDPEIVSRVAAKLGLVEKGTTLNMDQSLRLIFKPGFSTTATVSNVSGRGVGLDVVESAVEQAGGAVRVRTQPGRGSEFEIRLPATFGILRSLVIVVNGHRYCVDASQIVDRCQIDFSRLERSAQGESLSWRGKALSVTRIHELLAQPDDESRRAGKLEGLICHLPDGNELSFKHNAIAVDTVEGTQDVLLRSLGRHAARWTGIAGAAELRDGRVALVLDLPALMRERI